MHVRSRRDRAVQVDIPVEISDVGRWDDARLAGDLRTLVLIDLVRDRRLAYDPGELANEMRTEVVVVRESGPLIHLGAAEKNQSAGEIRERIEENVGGEGPGGFVAQILGRELCL